CHHRRQRLGHPHLRRSRRLAGSGEDPAIASHPRPRRRSPEDDPAAPPQATRPDLHRQGRTAHHHLRVLARHPHPDPPLPARLAPRLPGRRPRHHAALPHGWRRRRYGRWYGYDGWWYGWHGRRHGWYGWRYDGRRYGWYGRWYGWHGRYGYDVGSARRSGCAR